MNTTENNSTDKATFFEFLKSPAVILLSMSLGVLAGVFFKNFSRLIAPVGEVYLKLLQMTIIPILMTALITSVGKLFTSEKARRHIVKIIGFSLLFLFAISLLTIVVSLAIGPGAGLSKEAQISLGKTLSAADQAGGGLQSAARSRSLFDFFQSLIPANVFHAMGEGANLPLLFFSLILGIATGLIGGEYSRTILGFTEALFKAMFKIISWIMYILPFGLFALLAGQIANTGVETLMAMTKFVAMIWGIAVLILLADTAILCSVTRLSPLVVLSALKESLLIAFGTASTFASMPAAIDGLTGKKLRLPQDLVNLVIPLGTVINRFSMIVVYASATVFAAQLYGISLGFPDLVSALFLCVMAALAGAGAPALVSIAMVSIVLLPLGLPAQAITILLLAVNPVIDPIATMANIFTNSALTAVIAAPAKQTGDRLFSDSQGSKPMNRHQG